MKQKSSKRLSIPRLRKKEWPLIAGIVLVFICGTSLLYWHQRQQQNSDITNIRELILLAVEGLSVPAPVDARTGDVYFPQAKLYLSNNQAFPQITYTYDASSKVLRVSTKQMLTANASKLYSAHNSTELFALVPKLQACSRGLLVSTATQHDSSLVHLGDASVHDGRTLHVYNETECSELNAMGLRLLGVQSY